MTAGPPYEVFDGATHPHCGTHLLRHLASWIEHPGTLVHVVSPEVDEPTLREVARALSSLDEGAWTDVYATAERHQLPRENATPVLGEPPVPISDDSFVLVQPVLPAIGPPCSAPPSGQPSVVLPELRDCREIAFHDVGPPGLEAGDVARARPGPTRLPVSGRSS